MKHLNITFCLVLLLVGCVTYPYTAKSVLVNGGSSDERVVLAKKVLAALPADQVRAQVRERFPNLTDEQSKRILLNYVKLNIVSKDKPPRQDVYLTVTIHSDRDIHPIASEIGELIAEMFRELTRQRRP